MLFALSTPNEFCLVSLSEHVRHARADKKQAVIMFNCVLTWFLTSVNDRLPPGGQHDSMSAVTNLFMIQAKISFTCSSINALTEA